MDLLELFAGSRSIGRAAENRGHNVFSVDWQEFPGIHLSIDIETIKASDVPFLPDAVWMSPDCTTYTVAAISHHRKGAEPTSEYAIKCDKVNQVAIALIKHYLSLNPKMKFYIENPRGMMRKMPWMQQFDRATVWYCQYGDDRAKPTDIWSNNINGMFNPCGSWHPRKECSNGNKGCHHESAPRGSRTGTQGKKGAYDRSRIPDQLCEEIIKSIENSRVK